MRICYVVNSPRRLAARPSVWRLPAAELRCMLSWQGASGGPAGGQQGASRGSAFCTLSHSAPLAALGAEGPSPNLQAARCTRCSSTRRTSPLWCSPSSTRSLILQVWSRDHGGLLTSLVPPFCTARATFGTVTGVKAWR